MTVARSPSGRTFPVRSLASRLGVDPARLHAFLVSRGYVPSTSTPAQARIQEEMVDGLFQAFARSEGRMPGRYGLPAGWIPPLAPWQEALADLYAESCAWPACLAPEQGSQVRDLILERRPRLVLEIGCFIGVSSIWIASALDSLGGPGQLHSFDRFDPIWPWPPHRYAYLADPEGRARSAASAAGLDRRIMFHRLDSLDLAGRYDTLVGGPVDFAFIDGDHSIGGCAHDFFTVYPRVNVGGAILLHDTNPEFCGCDGPRELLDRHLIPSSHCRIREIETRPRNYGMALVEKLADDPALHPRAHPELARFRLRSRLVRSTMWQGIRDTPLGRALRRVVPS